MPNAKQPNRIAYLARGIPGLLLIVCGMGLIGDLPIGHAALAVIAFWGGILSMVIAYTHDQPMTGP